jgi:branched-chain amino acid transport system ATP-binding protein
MKRAGDVSDTEACQRRQNGTHVMPVDLTVCDVRVRYGGVEAVRGVSLAVHPGEIVGLIGPNGAGKTSLLNAISGDVRAASGSVCLGQRNVTRMASYHRARLGMARTSQTARVFEGLTVYEGLVTAARGGQGASLTRTVLGRRQPRAEQEAGEQAKAILNQLGQAAIADHFGRELSGGQRRFVDLAMALIRRPGLLLLDEPSVGMSPTLLPGFLEQLRRAAQAGTGILIIEHALEVIATLCGRVIVMAAGAVIAEGSYQQIIESELVRRAYLS